MAFFLQLFGGFRLVGQDGTLIALPERARALLSYLAMAPSPVPRQVLAELLSAEGCEQDQRTALRQAAYLARKAMADGAAISTRDSDLWLNDALVSVDVRLFQSAVARGDDHALAEAIDLYRGPFLAGEKSPSPAFEEWLTGCRRDLLEQALVALLKLARADEAAGRQDSALARARRAVALDPLCEEAHRQVMRSLAATGHRPAALRQYTVIRQTLADELGATPDSETEALRETIAHGAEGRASPSEARETTGELEASTRPKRVMRLWNHLAPAVSWLPARTTVSRTGALPFAVAAILLPVFAVAALWFAPPRSPPPTGVVSRVAPATEAPRLSIVVLPFANFSGDPDQEYFADGITDHLTTDLSRIDGSFVIARHTAFTYKGKAGVDVREIGRDLGVRFVLEGSVRRTGDNVQISAQLLDAATGALLWADQLEDKRQDVPALTNEVTGRIAATLRLELVEAEGRRLARNPRPDPAAIDDATRGWAILHRLNTRENRGEARRFFERALTNDPNTVDALVGLAYVLQGYSNSPVEDRGQADALLRRALDLEPNRATAYFVLGLLRESQGRVTESVDALQSAIALDRNYAYAHLRLGLGLLLLGRLDEAIVLAYRAMRLNPRDPNVADCFRVIGVAHLLLGRTDEAVENLQRASAANPSAWYVRLSLAAAFGYAQRTDDAKKEFAEHLRLRPEFNSLAMIRAAMPSFGALSDLPHAEQTLLLGLRRAGLPDS